MGAKRIIVIGASSGGLEALRTIVAALPANLPAAICAVLHSSADSPGVLSAILDRAGPLRAVTAATGMTLDAGRVYVPPPDHHMLVEPDTLRVAKGPKENRFRPAIDPLFRSAAQVYGPAAIGVILTGNLDDGTAGLWTVKRLGGIAIVQDPADALYNSMPASALRHVEADYVVPLARIAPLLVGIADTHVEDRQRIVVPGTLEVEVKIAKAENAVDVGLERVGEPSRFACPECHGVLLRLKDEQPWRFRCHTGHAFSPESLVSAMNEGMEEALWNAIRSLEEGRLLLSHVSTHLQESAPEAAEVYNAQAAEIRRHAERVRQVAIARETLTEPGERHS